MSTTDFDYYSPPEQEGPMYCANHPNVETYLRCGKCGKPICAKCRVSTPVGFRCFSCANIQVLPTYAVSGDYYLKAALAGFGVAAVAGALMGFLPAFEFWAALLMAVGVSEAISFAANQKRGPGLQAVGMAAIAFGFIFSRVILQAFFLKFPMGFINLPLPSVIPLIGGSPYYVSQFTIIYLALALYLVRRRLG